MLDLRRLRLLRELDARGTVHETARALDYTPSAISQQLAVLEREAGVRLLERAGRSLRLTEAGLVLVGHAASLLDGVEVAEAELAQLAHGVVAGTVRVAAFQSAMLRVVAPALRRLDRESPGIRIEVTDAEVEAAVPSLRLQRLDVVVGDEYQGLPRPRHKDLVREPLLHEAVRVVLPVDHVLAGSPRVALSALSEAAWAGGQPRTGHREMQIRACRELGGFEPDIRHASDDLLILLELVRTGGACSLLPDLVHADRDPSVAVRSLEEGRLTRDVFLLTRRARSPAIEAVAAALHDAARRASTALDPPVHAQPP
jgi:DNA-binding transcriptional LysR family regulator